MKNKKVNSIQKWLPFESVSEDGVVKINKLEYVKILEIKPINYILKSQFEKEAILKAYSNFLKVCNFNIQIIIKTSKEDLSEIKEMLLKKEELNEIKNMYIEYLDKINIEKTSSSKKFFLIYKVKMEKEENNYHEDVLNRNLNDKYLFIKEYFIKTGNIVINFNKKELVEELLFRCINLKEL